VVLGVRDLGMLEEAIASIAKNVGRAVPNAVIDGYELQEEFQGELEAMVGFMASAPFGSKVMVGSGGTLVELFSDFALGMAPLSADDALRMIATTRLGTRLGGYRNLMPKTDNAPLAKLIENVSILARDLGDIITECDLNPVIIRQGSGEVVVVDALMSI
jgi:acetyltransferase